MLTVFAYDTGQYVLYKFQLNMFIREKVFLTYDNKHCRTQNEKQRQCHFTSKRCAFQFWANGVCVRPSKINRMVYNQTVKLMQRFIIQNFTFSGIPTPI